MHSAQKSDEKACVIYAPNIHTGGGFILLKEIIAAWPETKPTILFLDERVRDDLTFPYFFKEVNWVFPSILSRLFAELKLWKIGFRSQIILCCNGLPPLFPSSAKVISILQNVNYLRNNALIKFTKRVTIRLFFERFIFRIFNSRINQYFVQTQSMKNELIRWRENKNLIADFSCIVMPYSSNLYDYSCIESSMSVRNWDFIYISDGVAHKNHRNLFEAWVLLAKDGIFPTLAVTLSKRDTALENLMVNLCDASGAKIENLGQISHSEVLTLYKNSKALVYPSFQESFGLPLIEANFFKLPILAPELDYVRDVCNPVQTFDPSSPLSIARAIKRFLGITNENNQIHTAADFIEKILKNY